MIHLFTIRKKTDCLETINKQLKTAAGAGLLTFNSTCRILRDFKVTYLKLHVREPLPMEREKQLSELLSNFYDLSVENQIKNFSNFFLLEISQKPLNRVISLTVKIILFLLTQLFWKFLEKFLIIHQMNRSMNNLLLKNSTVL